MRDLFGHGRLVALDGNALGLEFAGLRNGPARLQLPDPSIASRLTPYLGQVLQASGRLVGLAGENIDTLVIELLEVIPVEQDAVTPLLGVFAGNMGQQPATPENGFTVIGSLAISPSLGDEACWLRLSVDERRAIAKRFSSLPTGTPVVVTGSINTYTYKNKKTGEDRQGLDVTVISFSNLPRTGRAPILSLDSEPDALPTASTALAANGIAVTTDAFAAPV